MTVRVVDLRDTIGDALDLASIQPPYRAALIGTTTGQVLNFPYNPENYTEAHSPQWADRNLPARKAPIYDWKKNAAGNLDVEYVLQLDEPAEVQSFIVNLRTLATVPNAVSGEPEIWQFVAGTFDWIGHMENLRVNHVRTGPTGDSTLVEISFTLVQNEKGFG